ncbi:SWIM zinc finger family protein [Thermococcus sp.]
MDEKILKKGKQYFREGKVLWVVKKGQKLFSKILGTYPYYVELDIENGENKCTCPLGRDCKHVAAVMIAFKEGFYIETNEGYAEFSPECIIDIYSFKNPEFGIEITLKELRYMLNNDESGSEVARLFRKVLKLLELSPSEKAYSELENILKEYRALFLEYQLTEILKKELNHARYCQDNL